MQPGVNFRVTDKNVEQLVVVKDAAPPAILPFGELSANDRYVRNPAVHGGGICQSVQTECTDLNSGPPRGSLMLRVWASRLSVIS